MIAGKLPGPDLVSIQKWPFFHRAAFFEAFRLRRTLSMSYRKPLCGLARRKNCSLLNWTHNGPLRLADNLLAFQFELQKDLLLPPFHQWYFPDILKYAVNFYIQAKKKKKIGYSLEKIFQIFSGDPDTLF